MKKRTIWGAGLSFGFFWFAAFLGTSMAGVMVEFQNGTKQTFVAVKAEGGKLHCTTKFGEMNFDADKLVAAERTKYFPDQYPASSPATTVAPEPVVEAAVAAVAGPPRVEPPTETSTASPLSAEGKSFLQNFKGRLPTSRDANVAFPKDLEEESFSIYLPANYDGKKPFGLFVFINAGDAVEIPPAWKATMEQERMIFIAAQKVGNEWPTSRRLGVTQAGILKMQEEYQIDPKRIYVSGLSGGARCASALGFFEADTVKGVIAICGIEFYKSVPRKEATKTDAYGANPAMANSAAEAKRKVKFAIITGETDWRRGNILDVYNGGYADEKFKAKLWDVVGMGHTLCDEKTLGEALAFINQ